MLLWFGFAILAAGVVALLVRPLSGLAAGGPEATADSAAVSDVAVYKDQLAEIEQDRERGLIDAVEAEAVRAEVARRLLSHASDGHAGSSAGMTPAVASRWTAIAIGTIVPVASLALYLVSGSPSLPSQPFGARVATPHSKATVDELIAKVEARLKANPEEGQGWDVIAPIYLRMGRADDAAQAYARAMKLLGETPERLLGFAESNVIAANGIVGEGARKAFQRVMEIEPTNFEARFGLALAKEQDGNKDAAIADYKAIYEEIPPDIPWRAGLGERLAALGAPQPEAATGARGPTAADVAAAEKLSPEERQAQINRMVEGLSLRLKENGSDLEGWVKLVRAYAVLGRSADAAAALSQARKNFTADAKALGELDQLAKGLGLGS